MEEHQADIVIGCESHLDNSFSNQEIFPPQYVVMGKDCCIGGGGVFLALKNHLSFVDEPNFHGNAEMVWVKLCLNLSTFVPYTDHQVAHPRHSLNLITS